ncbi:MAG TPA: ATP synthase F0 subunit C [Candidatus Limnocylindrales bacterium]|nr:ATP synthase F0 subunit C [Candidatus Limnocylindrales bacterium]
MKRIKTFLMTTAGALLASPLLASIAQAQDHGDAAVAAAAGAGAAGMIGIGAGIAIAGAAFGCALGQGRAVASAMESIGRNPNSADRIQTPMIIGLAMIEALAIYALVIAFFLQGKI